MRTLILRVEDLADHGGQPGYPIALIFDDGQPGWEERVMASALIPETLDPPPALAGLGNLSLEEEIRTLVLTEPSSPLFIEFGRYLYDLVVRGDVKDAWDDLRKKHPREQPPKEGIRTILDLGAPGLRRLPWELMTRGDVRLSTDQGNSFIRGSDIDFTYRNEGQPVPLRILVVVGCPADLEVDAMKELDAIRDALPRFLGRVDAEFLIGRSKEELVETYLTLRPHVLHFIGHGDVSNGMGVLRLCNTKGTAWELSRSDIVNDLSGWVGQLVILNACRTTESDVQRAVLNVADAFTELGYPAVVGMQGDILASAAVKFAGSFYRSLADEEPIDVALSRARRAIYMRDENSSQEQRDWFLPSVTLNVPPDQVLRLRFGVPERVDEIEDELAFKKIRTFVDRSPLRREISQSVDPDEPKRKPAKLTLVTGPASIGKSWLVLWCLRMCALRGTRVRYVDLAATGTLTYLEVLRRIARAKTYPCQQGTDQQFATFYDELNDLLKPKDHAGVLTPGADAGFPIRAGPENLEDRIFAAFRTALRSSVGEAPMVLALDPLDSVLIEHFRDYLWPHLFQHALQENLGALRVILVLNVDQLRSPWVDELTSAYRPVAVGEIPKEDYLGTVREFLVHHRFKPEDFEDLVLMLHRKLQTPTWRPQAFRALLATLESIGVTPAQ